MKTSRELKTGAVHKMKRGALCVSIVLLGVFLLAVGSFCSVTDTLEQLTFPLKVLQDEGSFTFYVNEEVLVRERFEVAAALVHESGQYTLKKQRSIWGSFQHRMVSAYTLFPCFYEKYFLL